MLTSGLAGTYWGEIVAHPSLLWRIWIEDPDQLTISPYHFLFSRITECYHTRPSARSEDRSQHSQLAAGQQRRGDRLKYSESFPMEVLKLSWARRHSAHVSRRGGDHNSSVTFFRHKCAAADADILQCCSAAASPRPQCLDILFELLQLPSEVKIHGSPLWWFSWFIVINEMLKGWLTFYLIWATVSLLQLTSPSQDCQIYCHNNLYLWSAFALSIKQDIYWYVVLLNIKVPSAGYHKIADVCEIIPQNWNVFTIPETAYCVIIFSPPAN